MAKGFVENLPVVPGALEAVRELEKSHSIYICTKPSTTNPPAVLEKVMWVVDHLGREWSERIIITEDKTMVKGDILIDDAPVLEGGMIPQWEHIIFDLPYNRGVSNRRRLSWENWRKVLV